MKHVVQVSAYTTWCWNIQWIWAFRRNIQAAWFHNPEDHNSKLYGQENVRCVQEKVVECAVYL